MKDAEAAGDFVLKKLKEKNAVGPLWVYGYSIGGVFAIEWVRRNADKVNFKKYYLFLF
jgi:predicted alpha/beta-fold hydrolase